MKGTEKSTPDAQKDDAANDVLEELFQHATARERPSPGDEQAIRDALHQEWRGITARRSRRRVMVSLSAAASVVLAVFLGTNLLQSPQPPGPALRLATVEKVLGSVFVHSAGDSPVLKVQSTQTLETGQQIVTGRDSRLALRWDDGTSVRMDQNSEIRLSGAGQIELVSGRLYADTEMADKALPSPMILTPAGPVRHLGTQYMTMVSARKTRVSVRSGQVSLGEPGALFVAAGGEQLSVDGSGNRSRRVIPVYGETWQWVQDLAPAFASDGRTMADLLAWVARESGRAVAFASPQAEKLAADTVLRGNVTSEPMRALRVMLQTTDLDSEVNEGTIIIAMRE